MFLARLALVQALRIEMKMCCLHLRDVASWRMERLFAKATIIKHQTLGDFNCRSGFSHCCGCYKSKIKVRLGWGSSELLLAVRCLPSWDHLFWRIGDREVLLCNPGWLGSLPQPLQSWDYKHSLKDFKQDVSWVPFCEEKDYRKWLGRSWCEGRKTSIV